jgi:acyl-[acyl-carrier-protein]-phospholipid O-acyltransferase/long-chain-fatty-acid--[acyl-carrier-protein] ligase
VLFALGTQSAFFGPCKYAILPDHLKPDELIAGNALLNTGTYLSILFGTIAGTVLIALEAGKTVVGCLLIVSALVGYAACRFIPTNTPKSPDLKMNYNIIAETFAVLRHAFDQRPDVVRSILGVAWFYFLGGMFMAQFPNFTRDTLIASETVLAFFLVVFSVGVAAGGLFNNTLLRGRIDAVYVPLAALGITLFSVDLYIASGIPAPSELFTLFQFLEQPAHWRIVFDVWMIAFCGGLFVVPLNAIIQNRTEENWRARIVAASAIMDAFFIFASSAFSALLILAAFDIREIFLTFALLNLAAAAYVRKI